MARRKLVIKNLSQVNLGSLQWLIYAFVLQPSVKIDIAYACVVAQDHGSGQYASDPLRRRCSQSDHLISPCILYAYTSFTLPKW